MRNESIKVGEQYLVFPQQDTMGVVVVRVLERIRYRGGLVMFSVQYQRGGLDLLHARDFYRKARWTSPMALPMAGMTPANIEKNLRRFGAGKGA